MCTVWCGVQSTCLIRLVEPCALLLWTFWFLSLGWGKTVIHKLQVWKAPLSSQQNKNKKKKAPLSTPSHQLCFGIWFHYWFARAMKCSVLTFFTITIIYVTHLNLLQEWKKIFGACYIIHDKLIPLYYTKLQPILSWSFSTAQLLFFFFLRMSNFQLDIIYNILIENKYKKTMNFTIDLTCPYGISYSTD